MDVDSTPGPILSPGEYSKLQWSHVLMDVDRPCTQDSAWRDPLASMEPRPDGRG